MRTLTALLALISTSAFAAPLLGTANSFATSPFCKAYACELAGKDALGPSLSEFRYTIKGEFPVDMQTSPEVVSVIRQGSRVLSANWVTGAQDAVLYPNSYNAMMVARLVEDMTGKRPPFQILLELNAKCGKTQKLEAFLPWLVNGKTYRLSCMMSSEYTNASRFSFHVYLP